MGKLFRQGHLNHISVCFTSSMFNPLKTVISVYDIYQVLWLNRQIQKILKYAVISVYFISDKKYNQQSNTGEWNKRLTVSNICRPLGSTIDTGTYCCWAATWTNGKHITNKMHKAFKYCFPIKWEVNVPTYKQRNLKNLFCQTECHVVVRCYSQKIKL